MKRTTLVSALLCALTWGTAVQPALASDSDSSKPYTTEDLVCTNAEEGKCTVVDETTKLDRDGYDINSGQGPQYSNPETGGGGAGHFVESASSADLTGYRLVYSSDANRGGVTAMQWFYGVAYKPSASGVNDPTLAESVPSITSNELLLVGTKEGGRSTLGFDSTSQSPNTPYVSLAAVGSSADVKAIDSNRAVISNMELSLTNSFGGEITGYFVGAISTSGGNVRESMSDNQVVYDNAYVHDSQIRGTLIRAGAAVALTAVPASFKNNQLIIQNNSELEALKAAAALVNSNTYAEGVNSEHSNNLLKIDHSSLHSRNFLSAEYYGWAVASAGAVNATSNRVELTGSSFWYEEYQKFATSSLTSTLANTVGTGQYSDTRSWIAGATAAVGSAQQNTLTADGSTFKDGPFVLMGGAVVRATDKKVRGTEVSSNNSVTLSNKTAFTSVRENTAMVAMGGLSVGNAVAENNSVTATGITSEATVDLTLAGGRGALYVTTDAGAREAKAYQNQVSLKDSTMAGATHLIGGYLNGTSSLSSGANMVSNWTTGEVELNATDTLTASENTVSIANTTLSAANNELIGGAVWATGATSVAENNTVYIGEGVTGADGAVASFSRVAGGVVSGTATSGWSGNTLIAESSFTTQTLGGFQNYGFVVPSLPSEAAAEGTTSTPFITVTGAAVPLITTGEQANRISVRPANGGTLGEHVVLISSTQGFVDATNDQALADGDYSSLLTENFQYTDVVSPIRQTTFTGDASRLGLAIENEGKDLVLTGANSGGWTDETTDESEGVTYGVVADQMLLASSGDLFIDTLMRTGNASHNGWFAAAQTRHDSADVAGTIKGNSVNALIGWGTSVNTTELGGYAEFGSADNDIGRGNMSADATSVYAGAAIYANHRFGDSGLRMTGYARVGSIRSTEKGSILGAGLDDGNRRVYWGAHLGVNYGWKLTHSIASRVYLNYAYDGMGKHTLKVNASPADTGAPAGAVAFDYGLTNTHRVKAGFLAMRDAESGWRPYANVALEDVLKGDVKGHATDEYGRLGLKSDRYEGLTGSIGAGWNYLSKDGKFESVVSVEGSEGVRRGVAATLSGTWRW